VLTRVDHVMVCVPDLSRGIDAYQRVGFHIYPGGAHTGRATHNAIAFTGEEYIEVLSLRDRAAVTAGGPDESLARYLDEGGGFRVVALQSDDLTADVAAMRGRGVDVGEIRDGETLLSRARVVAVTFDAAAQKATPAPAAHRSALMAELTRTS